MEPQNQNSFHDIKPPQPAAPAFTPPITNPEPTPESTPSPAINSLPVTITPQPIVKKSKHINWGRLFVTMLIVIIAMASAGGGVWYVMNEQQKQDRENYEKQLAAASQKEAEPQEEKKEPKVTSSNLSTLTEFCKAGKADAAITNPLAIETEKGLFGICAVGTPGTITAVTVIAKFVDNTWEKVFIGSVKPTAEEAVKLEIPAAVNEFEAEDLETTKETE